MAAAVRSRPSLFRALGSADPPEAIEIDACRFQRIDIFKHDSWAATARYRREDRSVGRDVVCKFNRIEPIFGLPTAWLGRLLARRESRALRDLGGLLGIPAVCGPVFAQGRPLPNAAAHAYVPGHPLGSHERPDDQFFPRLLGLLLAVHRHGIAYMDLHKRENILVGDDGAPWLIDFQVGLRVSNSLWARNPLQRRVLRMMQQGDLYHLAKHVQRHRPEQLDQLAIPGQGRRPWWVRAHRLVAVPLRQLRRSLLTVLGIRAKGGQAVSEVFAEDAFRRESIPNRAA